MIGTALFFGVYASPPPGRNWQLVWKDDFTTSYDATLWQNWVNGTRSANSGSYHDNSKSLAYANGCIQIRNWDASQVAANTNHYPGCGGLATKSNYGPGYFEARMKSGNAWSCFWTQGIGGDCSAMTDGMECDIAENCCPGTIQNNAHWSGYGSCHQTTGVSLGGDHSTFYTYGLDWSTTRGTTFYRDGVATMSMPAATANNTAQVRISIESGGDNGNYMEVDYVAYYQDNGPATNTLIVPTLINARGPAEAGAAMRCFDIRGRMIGKSVAESGLRYSGVTLMAPQRSGSNGMYLVASRTFRP